MSSVPSMSGWLTFRASESQNCYLLCSKAQLKELAYGPRTGKRTMPMQYTWPAGDQEVVEPIEEDMSRSQLRAGESLLEIHLKVKKKNTSDVVPELFFHYKFPTGLKSSFFCTFQTATFTPAGLRTMGSIHRQDMVTFCTYGLLDFEVHSTPLVSGGQPDYGFTSRYALTARDLGRLGAQGSGVGIELHQALGGVRFVTHGSGQMSIVGAMERKGEQVGGHVNITGEWYINRGMMLLILPTVCYA